MDGRIHAAGGRREKIDQIDNSSGWWKTTSNMIDNIEQRAQKTIGRETENDRFDNSNEGRDWTQRNQCARTKHI